MTAAESTAEAVARLVASAPPLGPAERARLAALLPPVDAPSVENRTRNPKGIATKAA